MPTTRALSAVIGDAVYQYPTVAALLAGTETFAPGAIVRAGPHRYTVADAGATDHHLINAAAVPVKFRVEAGAGGYDVRAFGALGDGASDDAPAIQAAFDAAKPAFAVSTSIGGLSPGDLTPPVHFPAGHYLCGTKIAAWSKVGITGDGWGSVVELAAASADAVLFELSGAGDGLGLHINQTISGLRVQTAKTTDASAFKPAAAITVVRIVMDKVLINGFRRGVDLYPAYSQFSHIRNVLIEGAVEQAVRMTGNVNTIEQIERGAGTSPETGLPWILVTPHDGAGGVAEGGAIGGVATPGWNVVKHILPQQVYPATNTVIRFERNNNPTLVWGWEETSDQLRCADFEACEMARMEAINFNTASAHKIRVADSHLTVGKIAIVGQANGVATWHDMFAVSGAASVHVEELDDYSGDGTILCHDPVFSIGRIVRQKLLSTPQAGGVAKTLFAQPRPAGTLVSNGTFFAGSHGWSIDAPLTPAIVTSPTGLGQALSVTGTQAGIHRIRQVYNIPATWVGQPFTLSLTAQQTGGAVGQIQCLANGAGLSFLRSGEIVPDGRVQTTALTFVPTATGYLDIGVAIVNPQAGETYVVDEVSCQPGTTHAPASPVSGGLHLVGNTGINGQVGLGAVVMAGLGTPEGAVPAPVGSLYLRTDGGAGTALYVKQSGTGATGWAAK